MYSYLTSICVFNIDNPRYRIYNCNIRIGMYYTPVGHYTVYICRELLDCGRQKPSYKSGIHLWSTLARLLLIPGRVWETLWGEHIQATMWFQKLVACCFAFIYHNNILILTNGTISNSLRLLCFLLWMYSFLLKYRTHDIKVQLTHIFLSKGEVII